MSVEDARRSESCHNCQRPYPGGLARKHEQTQVARFPVLRSHPVMLEQPCRVFPEAGLP